MKLHGGTDAEIAEARLLSGLTMCASLF